MLVFCFLVVGSVDIVMGMADAETLMRMWITSIIFYLLNFSDCVLIMNFATVHLIKHFLMKDWRLEFLSTKW